MKSIRFVMDSVTRPGQTHPHQLLKYWSSPPHHSRSRKIIRKIYTFNDSFQMSGYNQRVIIITYLLIVHYNNLKWGICQFGSDIYFGNEFQRCNFLSLSWCHVRFVWFSSENFNHQDYLSQPLWNGISTVRQTEIIDSFIFNSKKVKIFYDAKQAREREEASGSSSDRNEPFILLNTGLWDDVILQDHN